MTTPNSSAISTSVKTHATPDLYNNLRADALAAFKLNVPGGGLISAFASGQCNSSEIITTLINTHLYRVNQFEKGEYGQADISSIPEIWVPGTITAKLKQMCETLNIIDTCEAVWTAAANVTATQEGTTKLIGTYSAKLAVAAGLGATSLAGYHAVSSMDLSAAEYIYAWIYSSVALDAGDYQLVLDDTAACASPLKSFNLPAIPAATWTLCEMDAGTMTACTAIISVGLYQVVDKGVLDIYIDQIGWTGQVTWQIQSVSIADGEDVNPAFGTAVEITGTIRYYKETELTFPAMTVGGTPAVCDRLRVQIIRKNASSDTHGAGLVCFMGATLLMDRGA